MVSRLYRQYKRRLLIGMGILLLMICVSLALSDRLQDAWLLGSSGLILSLSWLLAFYYLDNKERQAWDREVQKLVQASPEDVEEGDRASLRTTVALIQVDDYDEVFAGLSEEQRPLLVAAVDRFLRGWAADNRAYLRKDGRDRYLALIPVAALERMEERDFKDLDGLRSVSIGQHLPVTVSIGVGKAGGGATPAVLGQLAQQAVELALARGGDQVVVKSPEHTWFYGGRSEAVGRRIQVKARITALELSRLLQSCRSVVVMGHTRADFDAFGAAVGLAEVVLHYGKRVQIVVDHCGGAVERLYRRVEQEHPGLLVSGQEAKGRVDSQTLLLLVDVHRPKMVPAPELIRRAGSIGIIDHHRKSEEFLEGASLSYIDPAASSTCEMVAGLLQHFPEEIRISSLGATSLLAGIVVDTKKFTFATTSRTFRVAALLRDAGAQPGLIRELFTDSLEVLLYRARLMEGVELVRGRYALAGSGEELAEAQVAASRTADTLLEVEGVEASFVFYPYGGGTGVSARSSGRVNVHSIMEKLGGGGHFTVAGAKLEGISLPEARSRLLEILERDQEEG